MQTLDVPMMRLAKVSFWARTSNLSAIQYNVELRTLNSNRPKECTSGDGHSQTREDNEKCGVWMLQGRRLSWWPLVLNATQEWTHFEYTAPTWSEPV